MNIQECAVTSEFLAGLSGKSWLKCLRELVDENDLHREPCAAIWDKLVDYLEQEEMPGKYVKRNESRDEISFKWRSSRQAGLENMIYINEDCVLSSGDTWSLPPYGGEDAVCQFSPDTSNKQLPWRLHNDPYGNGVHELVTLTRMMPIHNVLIAIEGMEAVKLYPVISETGEDVYGLIEQCDWQNHGEIDVRYALDMLLTSMEIAGDIPDGHVEPLSETLMDHYAVILSGISCYPDIGEYAVFPELTHARLVQYFDTCVVPPELRSAGSFFSTDPEYT